MKLSPCPPEELGRFLPSEGQVLEIGCGDGDLLAWLAENTSCTCAGLDANVAHVAVCRTKGLAVRCGRAEQLPFQAEFFDAVVLECVFSLCDAAKAAAEAARVLKPGGMLLLADLFSHTAELTLQESPQLQQLRLRETTEQLLAPYFALVCFTDRTSALRNLFLQLLMQNAACSCVAASELDTLKQAKVGYGIWTLIKR